MPEFVNPFSGVAPGRKLTDRELSRALRLSIAAEQEAVHLYEALADATENCLAREVLQDIANEERVHIGEFQRLLNIMLPDEEGFLAEGAQEVDEMNLGEEDDEEDDDEQGESPGTIPTVGNLKQ